MLSIKNNKLWIHIIAGSAIVLLAVIDSPAPTNRQLLWFRNPFLPVDIILHILTLAFGYLNFYVFMPKLFYKPYKIEYILVITAYFVLMCTIPFLLSNHYIEEYVGIDADIYIHKLIQLRHVFFLFTIIFLYSFITRKEKRSRVLEKEINTAEVRFLRAQINPHFFFNVLNTIYAQMQFDTEKASDSLLKMSQLMRYAIGDNINNKEILGMALEHLENYIDLQKQRFDSTINVDYQNKAKDVDKYKIATLVLLPFVENAFKYGIAPQRISTITIIVENIENNLTLIVINKDYSHLKSDNTSTNIGISNTRKRLNILYPNQYFLKNESKDGKYGVFLSIEMELV